MFESTGLTSSFDQMLINLRKDFSAFTIYIDAIKETCLTRVKTRDQSIHINVSDKQVNHINDEVRKKRIGTNYVICNEKKSEDELQLEIGKIIQNINVRSLNQK